MTDPLTTPLTPEEAQLAKRLRALPAAEPSAELDARIRAQAHAAVRVSRRPATWRRWGGALAAVLALGVGLRVILQPAPLQTPASAPRPAILTAPESSGSSDSAARAELARPAELPQIKEDVDGSTLSTRARQAVPEAEQPPETEPSPAAEPLERETKRAPATPPQAFPKSSRPSDRDLRAQEARHSPAAAAVESPQDVPAPAPAPPAPAAPPMTESSEQRKPPARLQRQSVPAAQARDGVTGTGRADATTRRASESDEETLGMRKSAKPEAAESEQLLDERVAGNSASRSSNAGLADADSLPETLSTAASLETLIDSARRQHAAGDVESLRLTLLQLRRDYPDAALPDDIAGWMQQLDERR